MVSVRKLAAIIRTKAVRSGDEFGRAPRNVHTDVREPEELGLIENGENGVLTVPYDEIAIHARLTDAA